MKGISSLRCELHTYSSLVGYSVDYSFNTFFKNQVVNVVYLNTWICQSLGLLSLNQVRKALASLVVEMQVFNALKRQRQVDLLSLRSA